MRQVFLSYASADKDAAELIKEKLRNFSILPYWKTEALRLLKQWGPFIDLALADDRNGYLPKGHCSR